MIGKVTGKVDESPHCPNGWAGTRRRPACNYTGGHFCDRPYPHRGMCRCDCGARARQRDPKEYELGRTEDQEGPQAGRQD